ncbi:hypothetical protein PYCC9005_000024 [Savitreella phatthalungensis]
MVYYRGLAPDTPEEKRLTRKIDLNILPVVSLYYLLSFLDRSAIGNAKLDGLEKSLGLRGWDYQLCLLVWFVGYFVAEVPISIILKKLSFRIVLPTLMVLWGIVCICQGLTHNFTGLWLCRFFLGITEAGLFPLVTYMMSLYYPRPLVVYRVCLFFSAAALAGSLGGLLAYGFGRMDGISGQRGWRWIFQLEGVITVVVAIVSSPWIHNSPQSARFLTEDERKIVIGRLRKYGGDSVDAQPFVREEVFKAFKDISVWLYGFMFVGMSLPLYTASLYLPTIIRGLHYSTAVSQLLTVPIYFLAFLLTMSCAHFSFKLGYRTPFILGPSALAAIGYITLLTSHGTGGQLAGATLVVMGVYAADGILLSWPTDNVSGQTKRAVACAMQITIGIAGGAVPGTLVYGPGQGPRFYIGHGFALGWLSIACASALANFFVLRRRNARKAVERETLDQQYAEAALSSRERSSSVEKVEGLVSSSTTSSEKGPDDAHLRRQAAIEKSKRELGDASPYWIYQL